MVVNSNIGASMLHPWTMRPWTILPWKNCLKRPWDYASLGLCVPRTFCPWPFCDNKSPFFRMDHLSPFWKSSMDAHPGTHSSGSRRHGTQTCLMSDSGLYWIKLFHYRIDPILDWRPSVRQIFFRYRTRQYWCRISDIGPSCSWILYTYVI
jgi:hypothetical protein